MPTVPLSTSSYTMWVGRTPLLVVRANDLVRLHAVVHVAERLPRLDEPLGQELFLGLGAVEKDAEAHVVDDVLGVGEFWERGG